MEKKQEIAEEYRQQKKSMDMADEIVLYGKSIILPIIQTALRECGIEKPMRIFDQGRFADDENKKKQDDNKNRVVILCGMRANTREVMKKSALEYFGCDAKIFDFFPVYFCWITEVIKRDCDYNELADTIYKSRNEETIHNMDSINTTFCNLRCKNCCDAIPYRNDNKTIDAAQQVCWIKNLTDVMPITYCDIHGGEPLLDPKFDEFVLSHACNPRIGAITVATNGTIVPNDKVMSALRHSGAMLRISDYGIISKKKDELIKKAEEFRVPYGIYAKAETWLTCGEFKSHNRTHEENREIGKECLFGTKCLLLYDGKLYCCDRTWSNNMSLIGRDAIDANTLDVNNPVSSTQIKDIVSGKRLYKMCDYCDYPMKEIPAATQLETK